jgi:prophage tail gpP-like protein
LPYDAPETTVTPRAGTPGEIPETPLIVRLPALGRELTNIPDWSISSSFMTSTDGFEFSLYEEDVEKTRGLELQPVELVVYGQTRLIGRIDGSRRGRNGYTVTYRGRDFIADLVECNVDPTLSIHAGDDLLTAIVKAAGPLGINTVFDDDGAMRNMRAGRKVRAKSKPSKRKKKLNPYKPQPGQGVYDFLNKIMAREGVTIQPGPNRSTVVLASPNFDQEALYQLRRTREQGQGVYNNIESAEADRDFSSFPTFTMVQGAQAKAGSKGQHATKAFDLWAISARFRSELGRILADATVSDRWLPGKVANEVIAGALYRLLVFRDNDARNEDQIEKAAKRTIAERLKETLQYSVTLKGHVAPESSALYTHDTMINVNDDIADVHEELWVESCKISYTSNGGPRSDLVCWRPESFELDEPYQPGTSGATPQKKKDEEKQEAMSDDDKAFRRAQLAARPLRDVGRDADDEDRRR